MASISCALGEQKWESHLSKIRLTELEIMISALNGSVLYGGESDIRLPVIKIAGILLYKDARLGILLSNEDLIDIPVAPPDKMAIARAVTKMAGLLSAAN